MVLSGINKFIDHTILNPDARKADVAKVCEEARKYKFKSVCVNSTYIKYVKQLLADSHVLICSVVGFPLGAMSSKAKAYETSLAVEDGADEIDMVINIGSLKDERYDYVVKDIEGVVKAAQGKTVKVIIETCLLTREEKIKACQLSVEAGADFVKTSTGFSTGGAVLEDVKLMRQTVGKDIGVKASGGIRNYEYARQMINAGASRIGASSSVAIVEEEKGNNI